MKATRALVALMLLSGTPLLAETFDYDGSSLASCVCPVPARGSDCGTGVYRDFRYASSVKVKRGVTINLTDYCFRRRDPAICCEQPRQRSRQNFQALPRATFVLVSRDCIAHASAWSTALGLTVRKC
jgi:hypothetical protein